MHKISITRWLFVVESNAPIWVILFFKRKLIDRNFIHSQFKFFVEQPMKRDFVKHGHKDRTDKVEKKATQPAAIKKEKTSKRRLSIYDAFDDEELDDFDTNSDQF